MGSTSIIKGLSNKQVISYKQPEESDSLVDDLMKDRLTLTLNQILNLDPAFKQKLLQKCQGGDILTVQEDNKNNQTQDVEVKDVNYKVLILDIKYGGFLI